MKKSLFIVTLLCICGLLKAQSVHLGLKAGLNVTSLKVEDGTDVSSKASFHVGGLAHIHLDKHFALQPELVFSGQGGQVKSGNNTIKVNLNYINIPVLAQYMTGNGLRLETGPQLGFLASAKTKNGDVSVDSKDSYKTVDFSWAFGVGYLFPNTGFGVDARYNLGIGDINDANATKVHNRVFQAGVFYQFMHTNMK